MVFESLISSIGYLEVLDKGQRQYTYKHQFFPKYKHSLFADKKRTSHFLRIPHLNKRNLILLSTENNAHTNNGYNLLQQQQTSLNVDNNHLKNEFNQFMEINRINQNLVVGRSKKENVHICHHHSKLFDTACFVMRLPFLYANTLGMTNDHWLEQRNRSDWWKKGNFPKLPKMGIKEAMKDYDASHPLRLLFKMVPLGIIFFCASFNLCLLQNLKDSLIVLNIGAETLPFLASFGVLPASILFFGLYNKFLHKLPHKTVFYASIAPLLFFYLVFATILFPASNILHPHGFFNATAPFLPHGLHGLLKCVEHWTLSLFFCFAELWGTVVISLLFWSLANDVCTVKEAKTIYPLMGISANVALVVAGKYIKWVNTTLTLGSTSLSLKYLILSVMLMSIGMMASKLFIDRFLELHHHEDVPKEKKKGTFKEGLAVLKGSPKILNLALLVIGYSISHKLFDIAWKGQLRSVFPTRQEYQGILADVSVWTGMITITLMLTGKFIFQYLGWGFAAGTAPVAMLLTGTIFYGLSIMHNFGSFSDTLAKVGAIAGNITQVASRSAKYSLFDPAKEMVFIEMNKEEKSKGKAAVDLVSSQVGKTGASWISQALLIGFGSISAAMPVFSIIYTSVLVMWIVSVCKLQGLLKQTDKERKKAALLALKRELELNKPHLLTSSSIDEILDSDENFTKHLKYQYNKTSNIKSSIMRKSDVLLK